MEFLQRLEYARGVVELVDQVVELLRLRVDGVPRSLCVVPEGVEVADVLALLLDPGVVLQVVDALAVGVAQLEHAVGLETEHVQLVIQRRRALAVRAVHLVELQRKNKNRQCFGGHIHIFNGSA